MAAIRKLTVPENVTLVRGAMQNWSDLETLPPVADVVARRAVAAAEGVRCLVVGPHDVDLVRRLNDAADELVVVVRAIPDAEQIATHLPSVVVRCGSLDAALPGLGEFGLVVALRDVSRLCSAEEDPVGWGEAAQRLLDARSSAGRLLLGVESDVSLEHLSRGVYLGAADDDGAWSPFSAWDETRPRSLSQLSAWLDEQSVSASIQAALTSWAAPTALACKVDTPELRHLWTWAAIRAGDEVLPLRSMELADRSRELAAGWFVDIRDGAAAAAEISVSVEGRHFTWTEQPDGSLVRSGGANDETTVRIPKTGQTLLERYVAAAANEDTPQLRRILAQWRKSLEHIADGDQLPAEASDVSLGNAVQDAEGAMHWLLPGVGPLTVREAQLRALGALLRTILSQGLRHPWVSSMHHRTMFEALCAQAGVPQPPNPDDYLDGIDELPDTVSPHTMRALIERQREELRGAWSRFHWDEGDYLTYRVSKQAKRAARWGLGRAKKKTKAVTRRVLGS